MEKLLNDKWRFAVYLLLVGGTGGMLYIAYNRFIFDVENDALLRVVAKKLSFSIFYLSVVVATVFWFVMRLMQSMKATQNWLIEVARYQGSKIGAL